ncbi:SDR family NAD(P)-dependent oxidoreductase [Paraburkholderia phenazinium]|uniref:SDR family NAD(P)-dependent oxidoreductase n=1 Tax=Paraburkholderia phenazinium TaxID=60549 RepID=UPI001C40A715
MAQLGFRVWLGARNEIRGEAAASQLRTLGLDVRLVELDVADGEPVDRAVDIVEQTTPTLDALVD